MSISVHQLPALDMVSVTFFFYFETWSITKSGVCWFRDWLDPPVPTSPVLRVCATCWAFIVDCGRSELWSSCLWTHLPSLLVKYYVKLKEELGLKEHMSLEVGQFTMAVWLWGKRLLFLNLSCLTCHSVSQCSQW